MTEGAHTEEETVHAPPGGLWGFFRRYIFATDHKVIGLQYLYSTLAFFLLGGAFALAVRWQVAWPFDPDRPLISRGVAEWLFDGSVYMPNGWYAMAFTMHASIMIFLVVIPLLTGAFGNYLIPLMIGARDMAFPLLNALSFWTYLLGAAVLCSSFFVETGLAAATGWTAYPPLSVFSPDGADGQSLWIIGVLCVGMSSVMGALNFITTIVNLRTPGLTLMRMPLTVWSMLITSVLQLFATPVLTTALLMLMFDRHLGTSFFMPDDLVYAARPVEGAGGGQVLLWQHLFWFYSHPAVYIMILPAMGMVSDVLACHARKPVFGYKPMVFAICGIAGLGFLVWGHHMFQSGMNPLLGTSFMVSTVLIAVPSGVKVFNWIGTLWRGRIHFTPAMQFAISFISLFVIGGLSGIYMASPPVDMYIHDTYFIVAHIHYVLFSGSVVGIFAAIYHWAPKMFGRPLPPKVGTFHFITTFIFLNGVFFPMHVLGIHGYPRRYADYKHLEYLERFQDPVLFGWDWNEVMTYSAMALGVVQIPFFASVLWVAVLRRRSGEENPWRANSLEWSTASPPPHHNWPGLPPTVVRGAYEYSRPDCDEDYLPQWEGLPPREGAGDAPRG